VSNWIEPDLQIGSGRHRFAHDVEKGT